MENYRPADADKLRAVCTAILRAAGVAPNDAAIVADCMVEADLTNVRSHGVVRLKMYTDCIDAGGADPAGNVTVVEDFPSGALLDANNALGIVAAHRAVRTVIDKARETGIAIVNVRHSNHCGTVGYFTGMAAREGLLCVGCSNAPKSMAPWGSRTKYLGTNPLTVGIPTGGEPIVLDMATSVVARGKIILAEKKSEPIPEGWAIDEDGNPTTNAAAALKGCVLPFAGPKGSGISMMIDILSGILSGSGYGSHINNPIANPELPMNTGHSFIAIDVAKFQPLGMFRDTVDAMIAEIKALDRAAGVDEIFVPGEIERKHKRRQLQEGILLPDAVSAELQALCARFGIAFDIAK